MVVILFLILCKRQANEWILKRPDNSQPDFFPGEEKVSSLSGLRSQGRTDDDEPREKRAMGKIHITETIAIDESELQVEFIRSAGPGGQNVNKVSTAAQLRFDVRNSPSLSEDIKERLIQLSGTRMTTEQVLIITARRHRTQVQNRQDAVQRLTELIEKAIHKPKKRHRTKPSLSSKIKRLETKRRRGEKKRSRGMPADDE